MGTLKSSLSVLFYTLEVFPKERLMRGLRRKRGSNHLNLIVLLFFSFHSCYVVGDRKKDKEQLYETKRDRYV